MNALKQWWWALSSRWRRWRVIGRVSGADELPERLPPKGVVLVGSAEDATWAAFDCPCKTGHRLLVNLDSSRYPFWRIDSLKPLSIRPSIDSITPERRCHFFIRGGRVQWARATAGGTLSDA